MNEAGRVVIKRNKDLSSTENEAKLMEKDMVNLKFTVQEQKKREEKLRHQLEKASDRIQVLEGHLRRHAEEVVKKKEIQKSKKVTEEWLKLKTGAAAMAYK